MPATAAWESLARAVRLIGPRSQKGMAGQLVAHSPGVDGSTNLFVLFVPQLLRSRSRTRRRRRKRSWAAH
jgi:hypothetical protein